MRVTDLIANFIFDLGVREIFLVTGGGMMFLSDGVIKHKELKYICNHHEQASAMAAVSYAKYNNNIGVSYVTTGCGGTNAITGLLNAWQDSISVIFISGQVKRHNTTRNSGLKLRQFGVQELDIINLVKPITKYAEMINEPNKILYHLEKAVYLARTGRPGPVWLDIPMDVQSADVPKAKLRRFDNANAEVSEKINTSVEDYSKLIELANQSKRPIVIAGQGVRLSNSQKKLLEFIEKYKLPVVTPYLGLGTISTYHDLFIGRIGSKGDRAGNFALQNSDLVINLGSRLDVSAIAFEPTKFAREARIVVVDIDKIEHQKKSINIDHFINADLNDFFDNLIELNFKEHGDWNLKCNNWKSRWPTCLEEYSKEKNGINLYYFVDQLSRKMKDDAVVVSDAGSAFYATTQAIKLKKGQRYITSGGQAEMGYTIPACIGVSVAKNNSEVLGITGDGSFQMNIQELQTIVHHNLPIKLFVLNNAGYLSIRSTQKKFFNNDLIGADNDSGVSFPSLRKIAKAYGIEYVIISSSDLVSDGLDKVLQFNGSVICEVVCMKDQEIIPTVSSFKKADGRMVSKPMEDMYPFLSREEFLENMIIKPLKE